MSASIARDSMMEVLNIVLTGGEVKRLKHDVPESVEINVNIDKITKKEADLAILDFTYQVDYKPKVAMLRMTGQAYCRENPATIKKIMAEHKKTKRLPMEHGARVINMINANVGLHSIFLIRPFNLMPPFMPPMLTQEPGAKPKKAKKKG
jgi:hypothetical protein